MQARDKDTVMLEYGDMGEDFYIQQVVRTTAFKPVNHYHNSYEIYYLLSGRRYYFIKEDTYHVAAGDLLFINKNDVHQTSVLGYPQHERIVMNFTDDFLGTDHPLFRPALMQVFQRKNVLYRLKPQEQQYVEELFGRLAEEIKLKEDGYELAVRLFVIQLLLFAYRKGDVETPITEDPLSPTHRRIAEVVHYIGAHYHDKLPLPELALQFHMSPSYLSRTFKKVTGFSLVGFQNLSRIREAQVLLQQTDHKVADIAIQVGFEQFAHFNRTFRRITGVSPTRYRRWHRDKR
jgi:AraC-like DNA-binding protein/quercetin dioxygenase-like cupin family protein